MPQEQIPIDLASRLHLILRALDRMVPEAPQEALEETVEAILEAVERRSLSEAAAVLERTLQTNTSWLRGYLLLATIYEHRAHLTEAMATIERGLGACVDGIRLFSASRWIKSVVRLNRPVVHARIRRHRERFERYDRMFRHRMAMLLARSG